MDSADNGVLLCVTCHRWVHAHPLRASDDGWLLEQVADIGQVGVVVRHGGAEGDVAHEVPGDGSPPVEGLQLLNGSPLLLGDDVDGGGLHETDVSEAFERVVDAVEVGGERCDD